MTHVIMQRILESLLFLTAFGAIVKSFGLLARRRMSAQPIGLPARIAHEHAGTPTLLYFWSEGCAQCAPQERQIMQAKKTLAHSNPSFTVLKLNALEEEGLASSLHVMTVPTTVLLDAEGKVSAWNPGLTPMAKLVEQLQTVGVKP